MARINIIVPPLARNRYSGGILCALEYAHGLCERGHEVTIVPIVPSPHPEWFKKPAGKIVASNRRTLAASALKKMMHSVYAAITAKRTEWRGELQESVCELLLVRPGVMPLPLILGMSDWYLRRVAPQADINIAFSFEAARATSLLPGKKFYFLQHFDPYFKAEYADSIYAEATALQSYKLGMNLIANSSWLRNKLMDELGDIEVSLCPNAIDHDIFHGEPKPASANKKVVVISYGGRDAVWKGFEEMAQAMAIARQHLSEYEVEWRVYGKARLPADNPVARYTPLGFLNSTQLAEEYRKADILLSASWYESFPLFPIEAMACGLAVITTQLGTEEYAVAGETAEIVEPRSPEKIAEGLIKLVQDTEYRTRLATQGNKTCRNFTWKRSVEQMERLLLQPAK